jgi:signal transduction histidine kinase
VHERSLLLSEQSGSSGQRRLALLVAAALAIAFFAIVSIGDRLLPQAPAYVPIVDALMFLSDLFTAALIYSQYYVGRERSLLALGMGYLFASLIIVPHVVTFPGNFTPTGLLGASVDTAFWLYYFCRIGLFIGVIAYSLLKNVQGGSVGSGLTSVKLTITSSIVAVTVLVLLVTWTAIHGVPLPHVMVDSVSSSGMLWNHVLGPALIMLNMTAIALLWRNRSSALTMWLLVAQWAWLMETLLLTLSKSRFTVFWYGGIFGQIASCLVLFVLLYETSTLYARLALAAEQRNKEGERQRLTLQVVAASLAHELQQPLATMLLNGEVARAHLTQTPPNLPGVRAAIDDMESDSFRASSIISSIRATVAGSAPTMGQLRIGQLVHEALTLVRFDLRAHDVSVELHDTPDLPAVTGNKGQLMQVLVNLITNALEAMVEVTDRPRQLSIRSSMSAPKVVSVAVTDSGPGIPAEHVARIFDPFFTTKARGSGLGLAICHQIVEAHGGRISASRGTEHGSIFEILLPSN